MPPPPRPRRPRPVYPSPCNSTRPSTTRASHASAFVRASVRESEIHARCPPQPISLARSSSPHRTRTRASVAGLPERSAASASVSNTPAGSPFADASTAAWRPKFNGPPVSTLARICGSQSQRFPAVAKPGVPIAAGLTGLCPAISGDSWPTINSPFVHFTAPRAVRTRNNGKVRPPLLGCWPP